MSIKNSIIAAVAFMGVISSAFAADLPAKKTVRVKSHGDYIEMGVLTCNVTPGWGFILGSSKRVDCVFVSKNGIITEYEGKINRIGVDIGYVAAETLTWSVVAASNGNGENPLSGTYVGAGVEGSIMAGAGVNALVGGFHNTIALQPVNIQTQTGMNIAATVQSLSLR